jgi:hypothetical protein
MISLAATAGIMLVTFSAPASFAAVATAMAFTPPPSTGQHGTRSLACWDPAQSSLSPRSSCPGRWWTLAKPSKRLPYWWSRR